MASTGPEPVAAAVTSSPPRRRSVTVAVGASLAIGLLTAVAGIGSGQAAIGSIAFGSAMAGCGIVFAASASGSVGPPPQRCSAGERAPSSG
jgi:hypothetical protein